MPIHGPHDRCRHVVTAAEDHGNASAAELDQGIVRAAETVCVRYDGGNLIHGDTPDFRPSFGDDEKSAKN